ncbi:gamma-glutamylcyclotransferase [Roseomonas sp. CCTCC AB2023176]|uniref:gamma-glutamylcyclotransferase n=1 Tax=Roseomonas sp. CCTCC AB2023176 TaxID=3342640 RepID=UPI0035D9CADE
MQSLTHDLIARASLPPATPVPGLAGVGSPDEAHLKAELQVFLHGYPEGRGLWLFAYGTLMAKPEAASPDIVAGAKVAGHVRAYSLYDVSDRGTREAPGLTPAVEKGPEGAVSSCAGVLLHLPAEGLRDRLWPAWKREMAPGFYEPGWVDSIMLPSGAPVRAATFLPKRGHPLYAGRLPVGTVADRLARARGPNGTAAAYLLDASAALRARGLRDAGLEMLEAEVARRLAVERPGRDGAAASRPRVRVSPGR